MAYMCRKVGLWFESRPETGRGESSLSNCDMYNLRGLPFNSTFPVRCHTDIEERKRKRFKINPLMEVKIEEEDCLPTP